MILRRHRRGWSASSWWRWFNADPALGARRALTALLIVGGLVIGGLIFLVANGQDRVALEKSTDLARAVLDARQRDLAKVNHDYAWWADAVQNLVDRLDPQWAGDNIGQPLFDTFGVTGAFVLDDANRPVIGFLNGVPAKIDPLLHATGGLEQLVAAARANLGKESVPRCGLVMFDDRPQIASSAMISYTEFQSRWTAGKVPYVLVFFRALDDDYLKVIADDFGLSGLGWNGDRPAGGSAGLAVAEFDGKPMGWLHWMPDVPGRMLVLHVLPAVSLAYAMMIMLSLVVLSHVGSIQRSIVGKNEELKLAKDQADLANRLKGESLAIARKNEAELAEKTALLQTTFSSMTQGVIALDGELRLIAWNDNAQAMLGCPAELFGDGKPFAGLVRSMNRQADNSPEESDEEVTRQLEIAKSGEPFSLEQILADGRALVIQGSPRSGGGYVVTYTNITERKQREAELQQSRARLADAARRAKLAYWRQDLGPPPVSTWAAAADTIFGRPAEDLPNDRKEYLQLIHPADVERVAATYRKVENAAQSYELEYRIKQPSGEFTWVHEIGEVHRQEGDKPLSYVGTVQDITDLKAAAIALEASEQRFRSMADTVPVLVWLRNETGAYTFFNKTYLDYTGRRLEDEIHADYKVFIHPDDLETWKGKIESEIEIPSLVAGSLEYRLMGANGQYRWFLDLWRPTFDADGRYRGDIGVLVDITERKRMEEELRQSQKLQSIGLLAGGIAHDLNNMLTPIQGLTELTLEEMPQGSRSRRNLESVLGASLRASELVKQILAFSRRDQANRRPAKLATIVNEVLLLLRASVPTNIEIRPQIDAATPDILADVTQLHQVVINLATNAAASMGLADGLLTIGVAPAALDAAFCETRPGLVPGNYAKLMVSDTGKGMGFETLERIFEPFFTTKRFGEGTGLGLSVAHGIVATHGGAIHVDSAVGKGTTFTVYIPALELSVAGVSLGASSPAVVIP